MRTLIYALFLMSFASLHAQSTLELAISNAHPNPRAFLMEPKQSGYGFFTVTFTRSPATPSSPGELHIVSFDDYGQELWNQTMAFPGVTSLSAVHATQEGGLVISMSASAINRDVLQLVLLDDKGQEQWSKWYAPPNNNAGPKAIHQTASGEFVLYGWYYQIGGGPSYDFLARLNNDGEVLSSYSMIQNGFWIGSTSDKKGNTYMNTFRSVRKYGPNGDLLWRQVIPAVYRHTTLITATPDGCVYSVISSGSTMVLIKFGPNGDVFWQKSFSHPTRGISHRGVNPIIIGMNGLISFLDSAGNVAREIQYDRPYNFLQEAPLGRLWLGGFQNSSFLIGRTDGDLYTSCSRDTTHLVLTDVQLGFVRDRFDPGTVSIESGDGDPNNYTPYDGTKDTLCFSNIPLPSGDRDTSFCSGDSILLDAGPDGGIYRWSNGATTRSIRIGDSGTYTATYSNRFGESGELRFRVLEHPVPHSGWVWDPGELRPMDTLTLLDTANFTGNRIWYLPGGVSSTDNPTQFIIPRNGTYIFTLELENEYGCKTIVNRQTEVAFTSYFIPNAFTPNGDGLNDVFQPEGEGIFYEMRIYNRWGQLVFEGYNQAWDGNIKGTPAMDGLYLAEIKIKGIKKGLETRTQFLKLLR